MTRDELQIEIAKTARELMRRYPASTLAMVLSAAALCGPGQTAETLAAARKLLKRQLLAADRIAKDEATRAAFRRFCRQRRRSARAVPAPCPSAHRSVS